MLLLVGEIVGAALLFVYVVHRVLVFLTPPERRTNGPHLPLPPRATAKEITSNTEEHVVVVGGSGFLGKAIVRQLLARGDKVTVFDMVAGPEKKVNYVVGSILNEKALVEAFRNAKGVIHTASIVEFNHLRKSYDVNVVGTQHVINSCIKAGVSRLVYTSSISTVIDGVPILGGDESTLSYSATHVTPYGVTKTLAEKLVLEANGKNGLRTVALRPPGLWGPEDAIFARNMAERQSAPLFVADVTQDWLFVENAAHYHIIAMDKLTENSPVPGNYYFVADGPYNAVEFCHALQDAMGIPKKAPVPKYIYILLAVVFQTIYAIGGGYFTHMAFMLNVGTMRHATLPVYVSTAKAEKDLGYKPLYSLQESIKITGDHFKKLLAEKKL